MRDYTITITAEGNDFIVKNLENMRVKRVSWPKISNTAPGLKYRNECIAELRRQVDGAPLCEVYVSKEAEDLIEKATEAARLLY